MEIAGQQAGSFQKNANPNFFDRNPLKSQESAK
jgi:hypothetical protein